MEEGSGLSVRGEWKAKIGVVLICIGLSATAVPFFFLSAPLPGHTRWDLRMPVTHDMFLHFDQMKSFYNGLAAGELYPRWEEDTNLGFGAPTTCFYPPGIYYLTSTLYVITRDWLRTLLGAHLLMMLAAAAAFYICARTLMSRLASTVAMGAYTLFPYHLTDQYQRGAMAELLAYVWMPLVLFFSIRLLEGKRAANERGLAGGENPNENIWGGWRKASDNFLLIGALAISYGAFLWSHPPSAYQFTLAFVIFVVAYAAVFKNWKGLIWLGMAVMIGVALSAAYLYPALREQNFIRHEIISETWPYHQTYLFTRAEYTQDYPRFFDLLDATYLYYSAETILCALALFILKPFKSEFMVSRKASLVPWLLMGCFASFMMLPISAHIGRWIPKIDIGIFSWRMLSITTVVASLFAGAVAQAAIDSWKAQRRVRFAVFTALTTVVVAGGLILSISRVVLPVHGKESFQPETTHLNYAIIPRTAPEDTDDLPEVAPAGLKEGSGQVTITQWQPEHRELLVELPGPDQLDVRTFNYPGWTAAIDGQRASIMTGKELGEIVVEIPAGSHRVTLDFLDTPPRLVGRMITAVSFLSMVGMMLVGFAGRISRSGMG